ncbi:MAG: DUF1343 domain-containing protein [Deltaproteobacteria bacterium]|nr:DUF1343 domain-containing protein [Deltaproteobacteria bacterium]
MNAQELAQFLNNRKIAGVRFMPVHFIPSSHRFKKQVCHGVQIILTDRPALDCAVLGIEILSALYQLYPKDLEIDKTLPLVGARWVLQGIKDGKDPHSILRSWQGSLEQFGMLRSKYLLYKN